MAINAGTSLARYQIHSLLGTGGMGEVYLAEDTKLGRKVAIKLLPSQFTANQDRLRRRVVEHSSSKGRDSSRRTKAPLGRRTPELTPPPGKSVQLQQFLHDVTRCIRLRHSVDIRLHRGESHRVSQ